MLYPGLPPRQFARSLIWSHKEVPNQGFLKQEDMSLELFLNTPTGQFFK